VIQQNTISIGEINIMNDQELREKERSSRWYKQLQLLFKEDDVFWNNEIQANLFVSTCLLILAIVLVVSYFLAYVGVFDVPLDRMMKVLKINIPLLLAGNLISAYFKGKKGWIKYLLCLISISTSVGLCGVISIFVPIIICVPVVLSCRYYSRKFTNTVAILTVLGMVISEVIYAKAGMLDLNLVSIPKGTVLNVGEDGLRAVAQLADYDQTVYLINLFRGSFLPHLFLFSIVAMICSELSRRAHEMVIDQEEISKKTEGVKAELNMATNIQVAVLPKDFPPFPSRTDIDIRASMNPAKEVGGDFYDFYLLDEDHLLLVIADVSGKGIPAALFMMISKTLIKTHAFIDKSPAKIAAAVNEQLCEENEIDMFVTAWIGVYQMSTGIITAIDAGHEYPIVKHGDGDYELVKGKKSFVLAGMENIVFKEYTFDFNRGDRLFLYTDGVPEATNAKDEMYGSGRLLNVLNSNKDDDPKELLLHVKESVDAFVGDAPQFDDLTMMSFYYKEV